MFKKIAEKTPLDYLKGLQQDTLVAILTIHDEVNYGVDSFLLKPYIKKLVNLMTAKNVIDKLGSPYTNFLYDAEFNPETGAFTGEGYIGVADFSPYKYSKSREEFNAKKAFIRCIDSFKEGEPILDIPYRPKPLKTESDSFLKRVLQKYLQNK